MRKGRYENLRLMLLDCFWGLAFFVWMLAAAVQAFGQPPLTITEAGYFLTVVGENGRPEMIELTTVIDLTDGRRPDGPDDPDAPDVDGEIVRQIEAWADEVDDPNGAQAIAWVYSHIRGALEDELLNSETVWVALKDATDKALEEIDGSKDWTGFREKLTGVLTERRQRGSLQDREQIAKMLLAVQLGLRESFSGEASVGMDSLTRVAKRTNESIDAATE